MIRAVSQPFGHTEDLRALLRANVDRTARTVEPGDRRRAAVALAVTRDHEGSAHVVLIKRSRGLRTNPGQWALPGGRADDGELAPAAAVRELGEEVGIPAAAVDVLGTLDDYVSRTGYVITPVVLWVADAVTPVPNADEVASVHALSLRELDRDGEPIFVEVDGAAGPVLQLPILGTRIHAPTAAILYQFRELALHGRDVDVNAFNEPPFAWR
jgi:8-oxo-dGTP pyrophosphatase MutT (NUDIX family)